MHGCGGRPTEELSSEATRMAFRLRLRGSSGSAGLEQDAGPRIRNPAAEAVGCPAAPVDQQPPVFGAVHAPDDVGELVMCQCGA